MVCFWHQSKCFLVRKLHIYYYASVTSHSINQENEMNDLPVQPIIENDNSNLSRTIGLIDYSNLESLNVLILTNDVLNVKAAFKNTILTANMLGYKRVYVDVVGPRFFSNNAETSLTQGTHPLARPLPVVVRYYRNLKMLSEDNFYEENTLGSSFSNIINREKFVDKKYDLVMQGLVLLNSLSILKFEQIQKSADFVIEFIDWALSQNLNYDSCNATRSERENLKEFLKDITVSGSLDLDSDFFKAFEKLSETDKNLFLNSDKSLGSISSFRHLSNTDAGWYKGQLSPLMALTLRSVYEVSSISQRAQLISFNKTYPLEAKRLIVSEAEAVAKFYDKIDLTALYMKFIENFKTLILPKLSENSLVMNMENGELYKKDVALKALCVSSSNGVPEHDTKVLTKVSKFLDSPEKQSEIHYEESMLFSTIPKYSHAKNLSGSSIRSEIAVMLAIDMINHKNVEAMRKPISEIGKNLDLLISKTTSTTGYLNALLRNTASFEILDQNLSAKNVVKALVKDPTPRIYIKGCGGIGYNFLTHLGNLQQSHSRMKSIFESDSRNSSCFIFTNRCVLPTRALTENFSYRTIVFDADRVAVHNLTRLPVSFTRQISEDFVKVDELDSTHSNPLKVNLATQSLPNAYAQNQLLVEETNRAMFGSELVVIDTSDAVLNKTDYLADKTLIKLNYNGATLGLRFNVPEEPDDLDFSVPENEQTAYTVTPSYFIPANIIAAIGNLLLLDKNILAAFNLSPKFLPHTVEQVTFNMLDLLNYNSRFTTLVSSFIVHNELSEEEANEIVNNRFDLIENEDINI